MSLITNAILKPTLRKPLGVAMAVLASALGLLREAIEARAGMVAGVRRKP